jgi:hypothetical protein
MRAKIIRAIPCSGRCDTVLFKEQLLLWPSWSLRGLSRFCHIGRQQVTLDFDGGSVVTDAGLLPLRYAPTVQRFEVVEDYQAKDRLRPHWIVAKIEINRQGTICVVSPWSCPSAFPFRLSEGGYPAQYPQKMAGV